MELSTQDKDRDNGDQTTEANTKNKVIFEQKAQKPDHPLYTVAKEIDNQ